MRVFVAGASGAIGRQLVPRLVASGHQVIGMTHRPQNLALLRKLGAEPVQADVLELDRLRRLFLLLRPHAVIAELTSLPKTLDLTRMRAAFRGNNHVRLDGTTNLIVAAREAGVRRLVCQSMAMWYAPDGPALRTETDPLYVDAPEPIATGVRTLKEMEWRVLGSGLEAMLMRYGGFYGPGTWNGEGGPLWTATRKRRFPLLGDAPGVYSWIHVDDAAAATVLALERGEAGGVYNVVDDDPAPVREWLPFYAAAIGAPPPLHIPERIARRLARTGFLAWERTIPGVSNARIKRELGWRPRWASWREGFRDGLNSGFEHLAPRGSDPFELQPWT